MDPIQNQNMSQPQTPPVSPTPQNTGTPDGGFGGKVAIIIIVIIILAGAVYFFTKNKGAEEVLPLPETVTEDQLTSELNAAVDVDLEADFSELDAQFSE